MIPSWQTFTAGVVGVNRDADRSSHCTHGCMHSLEGGAEIEGCRDDIFSQANPEGLPLQKINGINPFHIGLWQQIRSVVKICL